MSVLIGKHNSTALLETRMLPRLAHFSKLLFTTFRKCNWPVTNCWLLLQVSLDSRVREIINRNMVEPSRATFDEAQLQIFTLMHRDSYPRFVNSPQYRALVDKFLKPSSASSMSAGVVGLAGVPTGGGGSAPTSVISVKQQNNSGASTGSAPQSSSSNSHLRTSTSW